MAEMVEGISPTRMELLNIKHRMQLAEKGHRLLKEKRDALMLEFMSAAKEAEETAENTVSQILKAREFITMANAVAGPSEMKSLSLTSERGVEVQVSYKNVMGVSLPRISKFVFERKLDERNYSLALVNPLVDEVSSEYEIAAGRVLELLEVETMLKALSEETKRTKRRVNALEYNIIPKLRNTRKYIEMRLGELERERFYRLKMVKSKRG
ncbi:MAG: V-type ATP synthase subunit D [Candidatus Altiarchaeales archaeon]|nr:V-type ATP synthase subunit D [Candidatus Altiarchaeales archaeon]